ncbi:MAG: helicase-related protein [Bacteroidota bacterium]|nr:helicase-related protein [Bacteroidota bacterium]
MPTIIDNLDVRLLDELRRHIGTARRIDMCIGFLNLKGWTAIGELLASIQPNPDDPPCRVLVGMMHQDEGFDPTLIPLETTDGNTARIRRAAMLKNFHAQLTRGIPTAAAQAALRQLAQQIRSGLVRIKLYTRGPLHAKLYLIERADAIAPRVGYVGSSNLTYAGLAGQGELNVDVLDQDAAQKLSRWFDDRWNDSLSRDISHELLQMIDSSWAGEPIEAIENLPYLVYLKVAYHLSENARLGAAEYRLPRDLEEILLDFQKAAVQLAAKLVQRYGGVLLGDVVGLGKTLMATALARVIHEAHRSSTLVICPPRLQLMWEYHLDSYLRLPAAADAHVLSLGVVHTQLSQLRRYHTVIIDESHNLTNRETRTYRAIAQYIEDNDPYVILLSATPYNKHYTDLANQLRLFVDERQPLPAVPQQLLAYWRTLGISEHAKAAALQAPINSLRLFEESPFPDDWRTLMRHFMVRRTRSFIIRNYASFDKERQRYYVHLNGRPHYFPLRQPRTVKIPSGGTLYDQLYSEQVVNCINQLQLARYGLAQYLDTDALANAPKEDLEIAENLRRAGRRLIGFARANLFKRLESSGSAFLASIRRMMMRNSVVLYALDNHCPIPIGEQDIARIAIDPDELDPQDPDKPNVQNEQAAIQQLYDMLRTDYADRFHWIADGYFLPTLRDALARDNELLQHILDIASRWQDTEDPKLLQLEKLLRVTHPFDKVLVFTQFADTATTITRFLRQRGVLSVECVTADTSNPADIVRRFSPNSNGGLQPGETEVRILIATDTLSEGQNLQDCHIVVNFDLPWAIVRLIQRAGRVDRIGQQHDTITVYSFLPADGIEKIIALRQRLRERLQQNQEIIGTDERFFDERVYDTLHDLYTERAHVLDSDDPDDDVDLTSYALQIWNSAPEPLRKKALELPEQVYTARANDTGGPDGAIVFARVHRGGERSDRLLRFDYAGTMLNESLVSLFEQLRCEPSTPAIAAPRVLDLVAAAARAIESETTSLEGMLGPHRSLRHRLYRRLRQIAQTSSDPALREQAEWYAEKLYNYALHSSAEEQLRAALRIATDRNLLLTIADLDEDGKFVLVSAPAAPRIEILCTMGLVGNDR